MLALPVEAKLSLRRRRRRVVCCSFILLCEAVVVSTRAGTTVPWEGRQRESEEKKALFVASKYTNRSYSALDRYCGAWPGGVASGRAAFLCVLNFPFLLFFGGKREVFKDFTLEPSTRMTQFYFTFKCRFLLRRDRTNL